MRLEWRRADDERTESSCFMLIEHSPLCHSVMYGLLPSQELVSLLGMLSTKFTAWFCIFPS